MSERWVSLAGYEDIYEISDLGRIRNMRGRILKPHPNGGGYLAVSLFNGRAKTWLVHRLVLRSFIGEPQAGHEGCHANGDRADARLSNLRWDTHSANIADTIAMGRYRNGHTGRTHCVKGHLYDEANTYIQPNGTRRCRTCKQAAWQAWADRGSRPSRAKEKAA